MKVLGQNTNGSITDFFFVAFIQFPSSCLYFSSNPVFLLIDTHEIVLTSGDIIFYESSKVFHGRPQRFKGSWYSSVFVHYYPKFGWKDRDHLLDRHYAVPPTWAKKLKHNFEIPLQMVGTGLTEPKCPNNWCQSEYSIKREGHPVEHGKLITPMGEEFDFLPKRIECRDWHDKCEWWASWDTSECERNLGFMLKNCKKACKACTVINSDGGDEL